MASQYKAGAVLSYAGVAFNAVAGLVYTPWMVSTIGAGNYALYTLTTSIIFFFLFDFGLSDSATRYLSKYYAENNEERAAQFLGVLLKLYAAVMMLFLLVFIAVYLNIDVIYSTLSDAELEVFKGLFIVAATYSVLSFPFLTLNSILRAREEFIVLNGLSLAQKVLTVALIVVALLFDWGVFALVVVNAAVGAMTILAKLLYIAKRTPTAMSVRFWSGTFAKEIFAFSGWVTVSQVSKRMIFSVMPTILAITSVSIEIAAFGLATTIDSSLFALSNALNGMFFARVTQIMKEEDYQDELLALLNKVGRLQVYILGGILAAFIPLGNLFVDCWVGTSYESLYLSIVLLIVAQLIEEPQLIGHTALLTAGLAKERAYAGLACGIMNIVLGAVLTIVWGCVGACLSICVSKTLAVMILNHYYSSRLGLNMKQFYVDCYAKWFVPAMISSAITLVFVMIAPFSGWMGFLVGCVVFCIVYLPLEWLISFNSYEKNLVRSMVHKVTAR